VGRGGYRYCVWKRFVGELEHARLVQAAEGLYLRNREISDAAQ